MSRRAGPNVNQIAVYSGHKRMQCLIYQAIKSPDGLILALYGPEVGRRHDLSLLWQGNWEQLLAHILHILLVEG